MQDISAGIAPALCDSNDEFLRLEQGQVFNNIFNPGGIVRFVDSKIQLGGVLYKLRFTRQHGDTVMFHVVNAENVGGPLQAVATSALSPDEMNLPINGQGSQIESIMMVKSFLWHEQKMTEPPAAIGQPILNDLREICNGKEPDDPWGTAAWEVCVTALMAGNARIIPGNACVPSVHFEEMAAPVYLQCELRHTTGYSWYLDMVKCGEEKLLPAVK